LKEELVAERGPILIRVCSLRADDDE
jgi:hypothetical protein